MKTQQKQALSAIKNECNPMTLPCILQRLRREKTLVEAELAQMPPDAWLNVRGRALANREQELYITLQVLEGLAKAPLHVAPITEPAH